MSYARIAETTWSDPKIKKLSPEGKLVWLFLLTNRQRHYSGIFYLDIELIPILTGLNGDKAKKAFDELIILKLLIFDEITSVVFIRKMFLYQAGGGEGLNLTEKQKAGVVNHLKTLHNSILIIDFLKEYNSLALNYEYFPNLIETPLEGVSPQSQSQSQSQEQSQSQSRPPLNPPQKNRTRKKLKVSLPQDFGISDEVKRWAEEKGHNHLEDHLEAFKEWALSTGKEYLDWDATFKRAIREDWGKVKQRSRDDPRCSQPGLASWLQKKNQG